MTTLWTVHGSDGREYVMELGCRRVRSAKHPYVTVMFTEEPLTEQNIDGTLRQERPDFASASMYRAGPPNWEPCEFVPIEPSEIVLDEPSGNMLWKN